MTEEELALKKALVASLKQEVGSFYNNLFKLGTGSHFRAFVEWCGVMTEHLNIVDDLLNTGIDAMNMNIHTGEALPIPDYRLEYLSEKMECLFNGTLTVTVVNLKLEKEVI